MAMENKKVYVESCVAPVAWRSGDPLPHCKEWNGTICYNHARQVVADEDEASEFKIKMDKKDYTICFVEKCVQDDGASIWKYTRKTRHIDVLLREVRGDINVTIDVTKTYFGTTKVSAMMTTAPHETVFANEYHSYEECKACDLRRLIQAELISSNRMTRNQKVWMVDGKGDALTRAKVIVPQYMGAGAKREPRLKASYRQVCEKFFTKNYDK